MNTIFERDLLKYFKLWLFIVTTWSYISSELNTPIVFSEGHLYGAAPTNVLFEDRLGDVDDQYEKFGGFRGSRASQPGNPGNANDETFGAD